MGPTDDFLALLGGMRRQLSTPSISCNLEIRNVLYDGMGIVRSFGKRWEVGGPFLGNTLYCYTIALFPCHGILLLPEDVEGEGLRKRISIPLHLVKT
jgi:hypothetical protein